MHGGWKGKSSKWKARFLQPDLVACVAHVESYFSHEGGASPGWMVRAESADTTGNAAAVKVRHEVFPEGLRKRLSPTGGFTLKAGAG
jgi:hypothetical protein